MTDFYQWGNEYLQEAHRLKARVELLKDELPLAGPSEVKDLNYRITLLYSMYLECRNTGRYLQSCCKEEEVS